MEQRRLGPPSVSLVGLGCNSVGTALTEDDEHQLDLLLAHG